ncbi:MULTISPECIES: Flp family type IVb pilin [Roseovarius]|uniref:Flp family type IVb pilin n=1 Tax=Roseovarius TaxID=74030 RepID=UPI00147633C7|nr:MULTISPECIES: Flp family type IVb pilin [Roseovarius]
MIKLFKKFAKDESGAAMVEYGVALMVIAAIGTTAMTALGDGVEANVSTACSAIGTTC